MRKDRKVQMLSIVALVLAITGMSLGFAAFSSTLSISSSATVTPNSDDFKMVVYGLIDNEEANALLLGETLDFSKWSLVEVPDINNYGSTAVIDNSNLTINNINVSFSKPGCNTAYIVAIKNEGMYDAYLDLDKYKPIIASNCVSNGDATQSLVDDACIGISLTLSFYNSSYEIILMPSIFWVLQSPKFSSIYAITFFLPTYNDACLPLFPAPQITNFIKFLFLNYKRLILLVLRKLHANCISLL